MNDGCPWRVHAFKGKWKSNWKYSIVTEHTCLLSEVLPSYRNISCDFVAKQMYGFIMDTYLVPALTRGQRIMQRAFFCIGACVRALQSLRCSQDYLFHRTSSRKQLYPHGDMRYTGLELWGLSLRINENKMFIPDPATKKDKGRR